MNLKYISYLKHQCEPYINLIQYHKNNKLLIKIKCSLGSYFTKIHQCYKNLFGEIASQQRFEFLSIIR
jgi:hypothetical protein